MCSQQSKGAKRPQKSFNRADAFFIKITRFHAVLKPIFRSLKPFQAFSSLLNLRARDFSFYMNTYSGAPRLAAHALAGMVSGLASAFILFGLVAAVCCKVDIPPHLLLPLSTVAVSFAMLPAGLVFAALHGEKGMLYGLLMGAMFFVALWIAALAQGQTEFTSLSAVKGVAMMSAGAIGGYLGIALRERRRRIH